MEKWNVRRFIHFVESMLEAFLEHVSHVNKDCDIYWEMHCLDLFSCFNFVWRCWCWNDNSGFVFFFCFFGSRHHVTSAKSVDLSSIFLKCFPDACLLYRIRNWHPQQHLILEAETFVILTEQNNLWILYGKTTMWKKHSNDLTLLHHVIFVYFHETS